MNDKYCYSWNGENYYGSFDTEQEAIEEAREYYPEEEYVYIGTCTEPKLKWFSNEEEIIESIIENLAEDAGEASEYFEVDIKDELALAKMIDETVKTWIFQNNIKPNCYVVLDGRKIKLKNRKE